MPHKRRLRVADIVLALRGQLLAAHEEKNKDALSKLGDIFNHLLDIAYDVHDRRIAGLLEDMIYAVNHFLMGVDFKAFAAIPSPEAIEALDTASDKYAGVQARLIRRAVAKNEMRPPDLGYKMDPTGTYVRIEPDWVGVADVHGPYADTFDLLCYKSDGTVVTWYEFDTLENALDYGERKCDIHAVEWEVCDIDISGEDSRVVW